MNDNNDKSLRKLARAISFAEGDFSLILAHCNYTELRQELIEQLQAGCSVAIRQLVLDPSAITLETSIDAELEPEPPSALIISGLESSWNLDVVLAAANNARDEYRQKYPFPLVLWVTDEVEKQMRRIAPDFTSWAKAPIEFELPTDRLIEKIEQGTDAVFAKIEEAGADRFLDNMALNLQSGSPLCWELSSGRSELKDREVQLPPAIEASLEFVLGRAAIEENLSQSRDHYEKSLALFDEVLSAASVEGNESGLLRKKGCVLFSLGLWWRSYGVQDRAEKERASSAAKEYFQQAVAVFEQANSPDLVAKFINGLGDELQRRKEWDELEAVARKAQDLHETDNDIFRRARADCFLAEVTLAKKAWKQAKSYAREALDRLDQVDQSDNLDRELSYYRSCYGFALARVHKQQGKISEAIQHLETAKAQTKPHYDPLLYIEILKELRDSYFQQKEYGDAFDVKQAQQSIESQFGFRAFIGAGRLSPRQQQTNYALPVGQGPGGMVPEIAASGREQDVDRLVDRMARNDCKLTVIYGPSGVGKSSILQAGLIPALQSQAIGSREVLPVLQRVYTNWMAELGKCLVGSLKMTVTLDETTAILNRLRSNAEANLLTVLIFDQFEEFFFACQKPKQRQEFYEFLNKCLDIEYVKVILSLREDYLSYLLECNHRLVSLDAINNDILGKKVLYYLGNFQREDAKAVMRSLTEQSQFHLEEALLDELVEELAAELSEVRPIELQVVGAQLQAEDINTLTEYREKGPKEKLVERYLAEVVNACGDENKQTAELILYLLTDENNPRPLKTRAELKKDLKNVAADLDIFLDLFVKFDLVLDLFVKAGLLFEVPETPGDRYQLVHDYLVPFVRQQGGKLLAQLEAKREQRKVRETQRNLVIQGGFVITLLAIFVFANVRSSQVKNLEMLISIANSEVLFAKNQKLEALQETIQVGVIYKQSLWHKILPEMQMQNHVTTSLQKMVDGVQERNRIESDRYQLWSVSFSPDGSLLATAESNGTVHLWEKSGKNFSVLTGHTDKVNSISFSPDGQLLATAADDGTARLWDLSSGQKLEKMIRHQGKVLSVSFSPDGSVLATSGSDGTVRFWDLSGQLLEQFQAHEGWVWSVSFSPNGSQLATASEDGRPVLWNLQGEKLAEFKGHQRRVNSISFSPDGQLLATAGADGTARLWNLQGQQIAELKGHLGAVLSVSFSPDGQLLASAGADSTVRLWSYRSKQQIFQPLAQFKGHQNWVTSLSFSPDSKVLATASLDGTTRLWDLQEKQVQKFASPGNNRIKSVSFSPDGQLLATVGTNGTALLWDVESGQQLSEMRGHLGVVWNISFSPDGQLLATVGGDRTFRLWDLQGKPLLMVTGHEGEEIRNISFSADGKYLATVGDSGIAKLWDLQGNQLAEFKGHRGKVLSVSFSPADSGLLATAGEDGTTRLWNLQGKQLLKVKAYSGWINSISFSPDGQKLATAGDDNVFRLWNLQGELLAEGKGHIGSIQRIVFSADSQRLATAGNDGTARLWDLQGNQLAEWTAHAGWVTGISLHPEGTLLATAGDDGIAKLWPIEEFDRLLSRGCDWLSDYLEHNQNVTEKDRQACDFILGAED